MQLCPGFNQTLLPLGKAAGEYFDRINSNDGHLVLIVSVKVRRVVRSAHLDKHPDDYSKKAAEFWHNKPIHHRHRSSAQRRVRAEATHPLNFFATMVAL